MLCTWLVSCLIWFFRLNAWILHRCSDDIFVYHTVQMWEWRFIKLTPTNLGLRRNWLIDRGPTVVSSQCVSWEEKINSKICFPEKHSDQIKDNIQQHRVPRDTWSGKSRFRSILFAFPRLLNENPSGFIDGSMWRWTLSTIRVACTSHNRKLSFETLKRKIRTPFLHHPRIRKKFIKNQISSEEVLSHPITQFWLIQHGIARWVSETIKWYY